MLLRLYKKLKSEKANTLLENVIILPLIIIVIYFMILASFVIHDHSTLDAAAKRGTIYAARCVSDPNYPMILQQSGHQSGTLDTNVVKWDADSFKGVGDNIKPYRYLVMNTADIRDATVNEVYNIIQQTKIPWREIETEDIVVKIDNKIIYQNVEVSITARYPLPQIFGSFGLPTEFNYTVSAVTAVNDPDEFIRNVDLIVDVCAAIDQKTGGNIQKVLAKLNDMGTRLTQFLSGEGGVGGSGGAGSNPGGGSGGGDEGDYIAGVGDNAGGDGSLESGENGGSGGSGGGDESVGTEEGDESGGTGEGGTEIAGNITPVVPIIVGEDKEEEEKPQESSDAAAGETTDREEATPEPTTTEAPQTTATPVPTETPQTTATPVPTETPQATATPTPTATPVSSVTFTSWEQMKDAYPRHVWAYIHENKPMYSPDIEKWFEKGGTITIEENAEGDKIWTYTSPKGVSVPYINGYIKFPDQYLFPTPEPLNIGKFTDSRKTDKELALELLAEMGINEIPKGYVLHHDTTNGVLLLVKEEIHTEFTHIGGHSMYGKDEGE